MIDSLSISFFAWVLIWHDRDYRTSCIISVKISDFSYLSEQGHKLTTESMITNEYAVDSHHQVLTRPEKVIIV